MDPTSKLTLELKNSLMELEISIDILNSRHFKQKKEGMSSKTGHLNLLRGIKRKGKSMWYIKNIIK